MPGGCNDNHATKIKIRVNVNGNLCPVALALPVRLLRREGHVAGRPYRSPRAVPLLTEELVRRADPQARRKTALHCYRPLFAPPPPWPPAANQNSILFELLALSHFSTRRDLLISTIISLLHIVRDLAHPPKSGVAVEVARLPQRKRGHPAPDATPRNTASTEVEDYYILFLWAHRDSSSRGPR
jgi:hypothetical protein